MQRGRQSRHAPNQPRSIQKTCPRYHLRQAAGVGLPGLTNRMPASMGSEQEHPILQIERDQPLAVEPVAWMHPSHLKMLPARGQMVRPKLILKALLAAPILLMRLTLRQVRARLAALPSFATSGQCRKWLNLSGGHPSLKKKQAGPHHHCRLSTLANRQEQGWHFVLPPVPQLHHQAMLRFRTDQPGRRRRVKSGADRQAVQAGHPEKCHWCCDLSTRNCRRKSGLRNGVKKHAMMDRANTNPLLQHGQLMPRACQ